MLKVPYQEAVMAHSKILALALITALVASCSSGDSPTGGGGGGGCSGTNSAPKVCDNFYSPGTVTITAGTTVTWTWGGAANHSVTITGVPSSGIKSSGTFAHTFSTPGTFTYDCDVHGASMSGTVQVN